VVAVSVSDIHISPTAPVARGDADWWEAQERPWLEVKALANKHKCPILCGGDVGDKWNLPPEAINFAIRVLPKMYSIPGQHDLPYHDYAQIKRSAYWTLVECGTLMDLKPGKMEPVSDHFAVMGFPWGHELKQWVMGRPIHGFNIALVHKHVWTRKTGFPGADPQGHVAQIRKALAGYSVVIAGDNHKQSLTQYEEMKILVTGGFMRRKTDEHAHKPAVGLIWNTGEVTLHHLDCSKDVLLEKVDLIKKVEDAGGFDEFLQAAKGLQHASADFIEAVWETVERRKCDADTRTALTRYLGKK